MTRRHAPGRSGIGLYRPVRHFLLYASMGAVIGVIVLHPIITLVLWMEYGALFSPEYSDFGRFAWERVSGAPVYHLMAMNAIFAALGAAIGMVFAVLTRALSVQLRKAEGLLEDLQTALPSVIAGGENEFTEFKSTLRWDINESRTNRSLEQVIAKTIAGLMNHEGGRLLIGVTDAGELTGIEQDLKTLRQPSVDEFERALTGIVKAYLGGCRLHADQVPVPEDRRHDNMLGARRARRRTSLSRLVGYLEILCPHRKFDARVERRGST